jgi:hypothetical protein
VSGPAGFRARTGPLQPGRASQRRKMSSAFGSASQFTRRLPNYSWSRRRVRLCSQRCLATPRRRDDSTRCPPQFSMGILSLAAGPRIAVPIRRVTPFAQMLFGTTRFKTTFAMPEETISDATNHFAVRGRCRHPFHEASLLARRRTPAAGPQRDVHVHGLSAVHVPRISVVRRPRPALNTASGGPADPPRPFRTRQHARVPVARLRLCSLTTAAFCRSIPIERRWDSLQTSFQARWIS